MAAVTKRFGPISFDLAAHAGNAKHANYYTEQDDSFTKSWHLISGLLWLNPPFDDIAPWAKKCASECKLGARILFLTPASVGSNWFRDHVHLHADVLALNGRICFDPVNPTWGYPKDCILSHYSYRDHLGFDVWNWKI